MYRDNFLISRKVKYAANIDKDIIILHNSASLSHINSTKIKEVKKLILVSLLLLPVSRLGPVKKRPSIKIVDNY